MKTKSKGSYAKISRVNNFDLIRLLAAIQVVLGHTLVHFGMKKTLFFTLISYFPGVAIFFGISGFLITNAYINSSDLTKYFKNRMLRIFPALWVCLIVTITLFLLFKVINFQDVFSISFLVWFIGQVSFFQFYTLDILRSWGVGSPNGSLWTITVELQFYIILPVIVIILTRFKRVLAIPSFVLFVLLSVFTGLYFEGLANPNFIEKLIQVSIIPYLHYFIIGMVSYLFWNKLKSIVEGKFIIWLILFVLFTYIFAIKQNLYQISYYPDALEFISNILLWLVTLSFAFTNIKLTEKILHGNDISYGVYIYHMLVINTLISLKINTISDLGITAIVLGVTILLGFLSWKFIEEPVLQMKKYSKQNSKV